MLNGKKYSTNLPGSVADADPRISFQLLKLPSCNQLGLRITRCKRQQHGMELPRPRRLPKWRGCSEAYGSQSTLWCPLFFDRLRCIVLCHPERCKSHSGQRQRGSNDLGKTGPIRPDSCPDRSACEYCLGMPLDEGATVGFAPGQPTERLPRPEMNVRMELCGQTRRVPPSTAPPETPGSPRIPRTR